MKNELDELEEDETEITSGEVEKELKKLKKRKAPGQDGIMNEAWMIGKELVKDNLTETLNQIWKRENVPDKWKIGTVKPIFKKGKKEKVENYRGLILMDFGYKIYAEVLRNKLEKEIREKEILNRTRMSFREGKGTAEAMFILKKAIASEIIKEKGKVIVGFADMNAAFRRLKRRSIWKRMNKRNRKEIIKENESCSMRRK